MSRISVKKVAELAGVHVSTVSRVLNRSFEAHSYAPRTIQRVHEAADRLGYSPSHAARALRTGRTMLVGMAVSDIANPFFAQLAAKVEQVAWKHGYRVVICSTRDDPAHQEKQFADLISRGIDGLIFSPAIGSRLPEFDAVVAVDKPSSDRRAAFVGLDNVRAGRLLAENLLRHGYRCISVVMPSALNDPSLAMRLKGLKDGLGAAGNIDWIIETSAANQNPHAVAKIVKPKLDQESLPDAIIGLTNWSTLGVLEALAQRQIAWGSAVGVAGIDDFAAASLLKPSITVVAQPIEKIAVQAFEMLLGRMTAGKQKDKKIKASQIVLDPIWVERRSLPYKQKG